MSHPFIVIEGLDGVGKTVCARLLATELNGKYLSTPQEPHNRIRNDIEKLKDLSSRFFYYLSAVIVTSTIAKRYAKNSPVVCDRYIYTTIAYHRALGVNMDCLDVKLLPIVWPNFVFFLTANEKTRIQRIKLRGQTYWDRIFSQAPKVLESVKSEYAKFNMHSIDTTDLSSVQVVRSILDKMG